MRDENSERLGGERREPKRSWPTPVSRLNELWGKSGAKG